MSEEIPQESGAAKGLAIAALVCGIVGFCVPIVAIAALVCGIIALVKTRPGQPKGMAIAGTVMGGIGTVIVPVLLLAILLPVLGKARQLSNMMVDGVNLRAVEAAESQHVLEHPGDAPSLGALVKSGAVAPAQLVSRLDERPEAAMPPTADNADRVSSYILVPGFKNSDNPDRIAAFVDPGIPAYKEKMHGVTSVVYEDGHVDSLVSVADLETALKAQTGMTVQQVIDQQRGK